MLKVEYKAPDKRALVKNGEWHAHYCYWPIDIEDGKKRYKIWLEWVKRQQFWGETSGETGWMDGTTFWEKQWRYQIDHLLKRPTQSPE